MKRLLLYLLPCLLFAACSGGGSKELPAGGDTLTRCARALTLIDHGGWTLAEISVPWDSAAPPKRFALVDRGAALPDLPADVTVVRVPLTRAVVGSAVHVAAIDRLGASDAIAGVTEAEYVGTPAVAARIKSGDIADCGTSTAPVVERIINVEPDAFLATPYAESDHSAISRMKIPVVEMADYLESTPEGRAEWLRLIGRLMGRAAVADSLYAESMARYSALKALAASAPERPKVITEQLTSGVWYVPGGKSYMARLLADAGADYPFADNSSTGSLPLDFAAVFDRAGDADFWLLKTYGTPASLKALEADYPLNARMKAWQSGGVYAANTAEVPLFEEFPFQPELLLADYILIFHPSLAPQLPAARYFHKVE